MKKSLSLVLLACSSLLAAGAANAQFQKPEEAIEYRQAAKLLLGSHFGRMAPVARGQAEYDAESIKSNVELVKVLAALPWPAFAPGTEGGNAKPEIWSNAKGFEDERTNFRTQIEALSVAANTGELDKFKAAFGKAGQSCRSCNDAFRKD